MIPKTDEEAANLLGLCLLCVAVVSGLTVPVLYLGVFLALNHWNRASTFRATFGCLGHLLARCNGYVTELHRE